ncbi:MAG: tetratricopeptide repeat protein [Myxococcales bacterium]|nr:tetratricopeptide repeat protein [Myxococcales bacterium]
MLQDSDSWLDVLQDGLGLARAGEFDQALDKFERARELAPARAETACALGREHMRRGQVEEALELLREAWQQDRSLVTAGTSLGRCLGLDLHNFAEAHKILDEVDSRHADETTSRLIRAEVLLAEGRHEEAAVVAEALQASSSERVAQSACLLMSRVENERGLCAIQSSGFERAIFAFKRAGDLDPLWPAPHSNLGAAFEKLGKFQRAEAAYREALESDPGYARGWHNLYKLYRRQDDDRASESIERAFRADTASVAIAADFALWLLAENDPESAEAILECHARGLGDLSESWASLAIPLAAGGGHKLVELCLRNAKQRSTDPDLIARTEVLIESSPPTTPNT